MIHGDGEHMMARMPRGMARAKPKTKKAKRAKVGVVMHEFKQGDLKSSSGAKVVSRDQALAIALSEAGLSRKRAGRSRKRKARNSTRTGA